ncbi:MAG: response regulator, partial [Deltaproteobacteria bacterium]|nr:response regulator [Deltaproteobacteria bacterium]
DKNEPYSHIISDIVLPDINGLKLLEVIKSKHPTLPVIMISGYGTDETTDEVNEKNGDAFLHKPFQIDELIDVIDHVTPIRIESPAVLEEVAVAKSVSAYALIRLDESCDSMDVYKNLYLMDHVLYCDAVRNHYDIILLLNGSSFKELEHVMDSKVSQVKGIREIDWLPMINPDIDKVLRNFITVYEKQNKMSPSLEKLNRFQSSLLGYVFLEIDPSRTKDIYPQLYFQDDVISCDTTEGKFNAILLIHGTSFTNMNKFVQEKVRPIEGVIRSNLLPIINVIDS